MIITQNTIGQVNLNNIKFDKKVTFNQKSEQQEIEAIQKAKEKEEKQNKYLNPDEQKDLMIHLHEDTSEYVSYEMIYQLILRASQKFEKQSYSQTIFNIRRQLWLHFMPLIDNMTSKMFMDNKEQYEQYCVHAFETQLS